MLLENYTVRVTGRANRIIHTLMPFNDMTLYDLFSKPQAIATIALCSLGLTGCKPNVKPEPAPVTRVEINVVGQGGSVADSGREYSGTVSSAEASAVSFSVPGTITEIYVEEGQKVSKGQVLARVKSENLINANNIAQSELAEARDAYNRMKKLHDANALPDIKWVEIQETLKQAENAAQLAQRAVGDATLRAPFAGSVSEKLADVGQTVIAAQPILNLVNLNDLQVEISVPEGRISSFAEGAKAMVEFESLDGLKVEGKVSQKSVVADPFTRGYTVKFDIPNGDRRILPGMIGTVVMDAATEQSKTEAPAQITLPSQSVLLASDNRQFVWVVKDGKSYQQYVVADELAPEGVIIKNGLADGDTVIVAGMQKVSNGTKVEVVDK